jgi:tRNA A37 methylthiotransferase MiaB
MMTDSMRLSMTSEVVATTQQVSAELMDEVVILSLQTGEYYGLDPVAADIWSFVQQPRTVAEIRDTLLARYEGVTPEECAEQVLSLLEEMVKLELIQVR